MIEDATLDDAPLSEGMTKADADKIAAAWIDRIRQSEKREDKWRQDAEEAEDIYLCGDAEDGDQQIDKKDPISFNIVHSNVETIVPAIYNSTPVPDIRPRHANKQDEPARLAAQVLERAISTQIDDNALDKEIEAVAQDAFLAGRGVIRLRFDSDEDEAGNPIGERVIYENVSWRDYREGPAIRWADVPWVAFRHHLSPAEKKRIMSEELAEAYGSENPEDEEKTCAAWEVWCKETKTVYFVTDDDSRLLSRVPDPLGLKRFFPMPEPVQPIKGTGRRKPVCPYAVYKTQARELDRITKRIDAIVKGMKLRGIVIGDADFAAQVADLEDWQLATIGNPENLAAAGGLEKAIAWWPVDMAIQVLQQLFVQREQVKAVIYEITGISDIIRGQSDSSETLGAQEIKTQWGSLRIKKMQRLIERQVRDAFNITAEIIGRLFQPQSIMQSAGMEVAPEVLQLVRDAASHYRIDVESDSTVRADLTHNRREMAEFVAGSAQYFQAVAPVAMQIPQASGPIVEIYTAFARTFSLGKQAEDALEQFGQLARQSAENNEQQKQQQEQMQRAEAREDAKLKIDAMKVENEREKIKADVAIRGHETERADAEALFNAEVTAIEVDMEDEQRRAVKLGPDGGA